MYFCYFLQKKAHEYNSRSTIPAKDCNFVGKRSGQPDFDMAKPGWECHQQIPFVSYDSEYNAIKIINVIAPNKQIAYNFLEQFRFIFRTIINYSTIIFLFFEYNFFNNIKPIGNGSVNKKTRVILREMQWSPLTFPLQIQRMFANF